MEFSDDFRRELFEAMKALTASRYNNPIARVEITANTKKAGARRVGYRINCEACGKEVIKGDSRARTCSERCRKELSRNNIRYKKWLADHLEEVQQFLQDVLEA
jgi:predicted nucleic acid-binding Zn ribbon protein